MTAADSTALATFMANVPSLPPGSNIKVLLPGITEYQRTQTVFLLRCACA